MKVLVLWVNGKFQEKEISGDLESMKQEVGGWLEVLRLPRWVDMWLNEEGKLIGLPPNPIATGLVRGAGAIADTDYIVGSVMFTGWPDSEGDSTDCPQAFIDHCKSCLAEHF